MKQMKFTLVELLVVVAIIAILAGLLMPAIHMAQVSAKTANCLSNQKQVSAFIKQYMNDNNQIFTSGTATGGTGNRLWGISLARSNYIQDVKVMRCPALNYTDAAGATLETQLEQGYGAAYSTRSNWVGYFDFRGTAYLTFGTGNNATPIAPNKLVLGGCSGRLVNEMPQANPTYVSYGTTNATDARPINIHSNKTNAFFLDGHSDTLDQNGLASQYFPAVSNLAAVRIVSSSWLNVD